MISAVIKEVICETATVKRFRIGDIKGRPLVKFTPGAHLVTEIGSSKKWVRPYSIVRYTRDGSYEIAVLKTERSRGGSRYWHEKVRKGDGLKISLPRNGMKPSFSARHHVFLAAGIGITPIIGMARWCKERGIGFELHYTARTKAQCAFYSHLKTNFPGQCHFYFTRETAAERLTPELLYQYRTGTAVYICGPPAFNHQYKAAALAAGFPDRAVYTEMFVPPSSEGRKPFVFSTSHGSYRAGAEENFLDLLLEKGFQIPYSCRSGQCGTCEISVKGGEVDHRDQFLTAEEKMEGRMLPCVSRGKSITFPLIIEL
ncbi:PDR/VanB family oxidoreductase [Alteribacter natronophilus]|uniref:PDR/VanB family oxidoreductase n=1 Tax=Alteribacter natronophilus TaxID=2583810 RepID=UPI00110DFB1B|nr:PDR/VanB family oxidoreductase [Alteribacter natronophilus]TMW73447.1 oxidoreductase [Alteribacter natronophilus]